MGEWEILGNSLHTWLTEGCWASYFMKTPPMLPTPFSNFGQPSLYPNLPVTSNSHSHYPFCCSVSLAVCVITLHDNMDLHISSLGILVPEGPWCVFYAPSLLRSGTMCFFTGTSIWYHTQNIHITLRGQ